MKDAISISAELLQKTKNVQLTETFEREKKRLLSFIRKRIPMPEEAEDILQDVFFQLTESFDVLRPIEQMTAWLFRVSRNKIIDRYRKKKPESLEGLSQKFSEDDGTPELYNWLFDPLNNPEDDFSRNMVWEALMNALEELPAEQRDVFVWHELEDKSFKEISEITGASVNTLLSRKRYAVLYLRESLQEIYKEFLNK